MKYPKRSQYKHAKQKKYHDVFLYDDSCNPIRSQANMRAYLVKIERLAKLKISG